MNPVIESIGSLRRAKRISLEEIARSTAISLRYLQAIEREDFAKLPGGVYNTSYIRQFARAIRIEERELLRRYQEHLDSLRETREEEPAGWRQRLAQFSRSLVRSLVRVRGEHASPAA